MRYMLRLSFSLLLLGMPAVYAQSVDDPESKPFQMSSRGSPFGLQAEFEGTYRIYDSSIEIYVSKVTFYVSEHCPYQGRRMLNYIKFALWNPELPKRVESRSLPRYVALIMSPREEHTITDLHFTLPKESTLDLSRRWLVAEMQEDALDTSGEDNGKGFAFVHSCKHIFAKRVDHSSDQKTSCN
jgi:hypothetical protein